jgi:nucleotide-binding universal stress UspA family protein
VEKIVVGVDGSPASRRALVWAVEEARHRDAALTVVYAYGPPEDYNPYALAVGPAFTMAGAAELGRQTSEDVRAGAERAREARFQRAEGLLGSMIDEAAGRDAEVVVTLLPIADSRPSRVLLSEAQDAAMLVVGTRGRGQLSSLVMGSVSRDCITRAPCPVVVVP